MPILFFLNNKHKKNLTLIKIKSILKNSMFDIFIAL